MWPDLYVQIHPDKAGPLGIGDGDLVRVETAYGAAEARAWVDWNVGLYRDRGFGLWLIEHGETVDPETT